MGFLGGRTVRVHGYVGWGWLANSILGATFSLGLLPPMAATASTSSALGSTPSVQGSTQPYATYVGLPRLLIKATGVSETIRDELVRCEARKSGLIAEREALRQAMPKTDALPTDKQIRAALKGFRCVLESGTQREKSMLLEENIEEIVVKPSGEVLLKASPAGLLPDVFHSVGAGSRT